MTVTKAFGAPMSGRKSMLRIRSEKSGTASLITANLCDRTQCCLSALAGQWTRFSRFFTTIDKRISQLAAPHSCGCVRCVYGRRSVTRNRLMHHIYQRVDGPHLPPAPDPPLRELASATRCPSSGTGCGRRKADSLTMPAQLWLANTIGDAAATGPESRIINARLSRIRGGSSGTPTRTRPFPTPGRRPWWTGNRNRAEDHDRAVFR